jgi:hypothetical protein
MSEKKSACITNKATKRRPCCVPSERMHVIVLEEARFGTFRLTVIID